MSHCAGHRCPNTRCPNTRCPPPSPDALRSILLDDRLRVKIADFGLSRVRSRTLVSGTGAGTPGARTASTGCDIWSGRECGSRPDPRLLASLMYGRTDTSPVHLCLPGRRVDGPRGAPLRGLR